MNNFKLFLFIIFVQSSVLRVDYAQVVSTPTVSPINAILTNKYHQPLKPRLPLSTPILSYNVATTEVPKYVTHIQQRSANRGDNINWNIMSGKYKDIYTQNSFNDQNFNLRYNNNDPYGKNDFDSKRTDNVANSVYNNSNYNNDHMLNSRRNMNGRPNLNIGLKANSYQGNSINNPFLPLYDPSQELIQQNSVGIYTTECVERNRKFDVDRPPSDMFNSKEFDEKTNENFINENSVADFPMGPRPEDNLNMFYIKDNNLIGSSYLNSRNNDYSNSRRSNGVRGKLDLHNDIDKYGRHFLDKTNLNNKIEYNHKDNDALGTAKINFKYRPAFDVKQFPDNGELDAYKRILDSYQNPAQDLRFTQINELYYPRNLPFQPLQKSEPFQKYISEYRPRLPDYNIPTPNKVENNLIRTNLQFAGNLIEGNQKAVTKSYMPAQDFAIENNYNSAHDSKTDIEFKSRCRNLLHHYLELLLTKDDAFRRKHTNNDLSNRLYTMSPKKTNTVAVMGSTKRVTEIAVTSVKLPTSTNLPEDLTPKVRMAEDKNVSRRLRCYSCNNDTNSQCNRQNRFSKRETCLEETDVCTKIVTRNRYTGRKTLYRRCGSRNSCHTVNTMYADVESCSWCRTSLCNTAAVNFKFQSTIIVVVISAIMSIRRF